MMISITGLLYVLSGLQYWTVDYLTNSLQVELQIASTYFSVACFTAPVFGTVCGGLMVSYLGGYKAKNVQILLLIVGWSSVGVCVPMPFVNSFMWFGILEWSLLFLGGFILPTMTGLMLNAVSQDEKGPANSLA